jgi:EVE domain-containing protein
MRNFVAVASAAHVRLGRAAGFMQVCHGKVAPLRRLQSGDRIVYYSPTVTFGGKDRLQAFTAIGTVREGEPYQIEMAGGFRPFRRDVIWDQAEEMPIGPLLDCLQFAGKPNWGYPLRLGLFEISDRDMRAIAQAMQVNRSYELSRHPGCRKT